MLQDPFSNPQIPTGAQDSIAARTRALLATENGREQAIFVVARNVIPVFGVLFLGWSAANLIVLYFVDTMGSMWAMIAGVAMGFIPGLFKEAVPIRLWHMVGMLGVSTLLVAFMAIPMGMPVFFVAVTSEWSYQDALADPSFLIGLGTIAVLAVVNMLRRVFVLKTWQESQTSSRREFGLLFLRWIVVVMLIYSFALFLGEIGLILMVMAYGAASVATELFPDKFLAIFDQSGRSWREPGTGEESTARAGDRRRKRKK